MEGEITTLLRAWQQGEAHAEEKLFDLVYPRLREIAAREVQREQRPISVQATDIVHEAYLRLSGLDRITWKNRSQFFAVSARIVRRILVDRARSRSSAKRGGTAVRLSMPLDALPTEEAEPDVLALDSALEELSTIDPVASRLVEVRYFGGLTQDQAAEVLGMGRTTAVRRWQYARAWLRRALGPLGPEAQDGP